MTVFINFFLKTFAFLFAVTIFISVLTYGISYLNSDNQIRKISNFLYKEGDNNSSNKIALINLKGPIFNEPSNILEFKLLDSLQVIYVSEVIKDLKALESENIKALPISINSPGGSVSATYNLYKAIEKFKETNQIKIFAHTSEMLASGGYWVSLVSDKIYADYGALIGSIGVRGPVWIYYDNPISISTGILGKTVETKNGIKKFNTIAGRSKDLFDSFREPSKEEKESLQNIVNDIYFDFVNVVSKNRNIENEFIITNLGALIFNSKRAKENFLIDGINDLKQVKKKIIQELDLKDYKFIEKKINKGFFKNFTQSSLLIAFDASSIKKEKICNIINGSISIMLINHHFIKDC